MIAVPITISTIAALELMPRPHSLSKRHNERP
jgi:hypothetical protein